MKAPQTNSLQSAEAVRVGTAVDLLGFPVEEARRLEEERIKRCQDPNAVMHIPAEWEELKSKSELFANELRERSVPNIFPESLFVQHFLHVFAALFSGDPEKKEELSTSNVVHDWGKIAGMPYRTVNIHADGDKSRILFTVPPVFHRSKSYINRDANQCFLAMVDQARRHNNRSPIYAREYFKQNLEFFAPNTSKEHAVADHIQWLKIFDHYGVALYDARDGKYKTVKELGSLEDLLRVRTEGQPAGGVPTKARRVVTGSVGDVEEF